LLPPLLLLFLLHNQQLNVTHTRWIKGTFDATADANAAAGSVTRRLVCMALQHLQLHVWCCDKA
jgi:hypothetical protein